LKFFSPLRGTNSYTAHYLLSYFFSAQHPKKYRKGSCCGPFEADHPERYKNRSFLPLQGMTSTPFFIWEFPPGQVKPFLNKITDFLSHVYFKMCDQPCCVLFHYLFRIFKFNKINLFLIYLLETAFCHLVVL